jgi:hypothetical protein
VDSGGMWREGGRQNPITGATYDIDGGQQLIPS